MSASSVTVRAELCKALRLDLVGPDDDHAFANELLPEAPSRWYLTGFLVPRYAPEDQRVDAQADDELDADGDADGDDASPPERTAARKSYIPPEPFIARPDPRGESASTLTDEWDEQVADLQYRDVFEFAVGHGVAATATLQLDGSCKQVQTVWIPSAEVERVEPARIGGVTLDMAALGGLVDGADAATKLSPLVKQYRDWIAVQRTKYPGLTPRRAATATDLLSDAEYAAGRIERYDKNGFYGPCSKEGASFGGRLPPPDLIIQDELHLISGPLGTIAGLYETAIDALASWQIAGKAVRPKVIASTATVRRASRQIRALFGRSRVSVFPPPGPDRRDSYFAVSVPSSDIPARLYVGVAAQGRSLKVVLLRSALALLASAQTLWDHDGNKDPAEAQKQRDYVLQSCRSLLDDWVKIASQLQSTNTKLQY